MDILSRTSYRWTNTICLLCNNPFTQPNVFFAVHPHYCISHCSLNISLFSGIRWCFRFNSYFPSCRPGIGHFSKDLWFLLRCAYVLSCVWLFAIPWTAACQDSLSVVFFRQEYWSGFPFPPPGYLPDPGTEPPSLELAVPMVSFKTGLKETSTLVSFNKGYIQRPRFGHSMF